MELRKFFGFITAFAFFGLSAGCGLENAFDKEADKPETKEELCTPQEEGRWTFSFLMTDIDVPTFDSGNIWAGYVSSSSWLLYNEKCELKGVYNRGDCGTPMEISEDFLKWDIVISSIHLLLGGISYTFKYANGLYKIHENGCKCHDVSYGVTGSNACHCTFPINGESD